MVYKQIVRDRKRVFSLYSFPMGMVYKIGFIYPEEQRIIKLTRSNDYLCHLVSPDIINAITETGHTIFHIAVLSGNTRVVNDFIDRGGDVNLPGRYNLTSLHLAAFNKDLSMVRLLLKNGAKADSLDTIEENVLHKATNEENLTDENLNDTLEIIRLFIRLKVDTNHKNKFGVNALWNITNIKSHFENIDIIRNIIYELLKSGSDPNAKCNIFGDTPLLNAICSETISNEPDIIGSLMIHGGKVHTKDLLGNSAFQEAKKRRINLNHCLNSYFVT